MGNSVVVLAGAFSVFIWVPWVLIVLAPLALLLSGPAFFVLYCCYGRNAAVENPALTFSNETMSEIDLVSDVNAVLKNLSANHLKPNTFNDAS